MTVRGITLVTPDALQSAVETAFADDRFWAKVKRGKDCWEWQGYRDQQGYGHVMRNGRNQLTHRYVFELMTGQSSAVVRHSCDNPPCCNPAHLQAGTQADNINDRQRRGRHRPGRMLGEAHPAHKLTDPDVIEMRRLWEAGASIAVLSRSLGINYAHAWDIVHRRAWRHVA